MKKLKFLLFVLIGIVSFAGEEIINIKIVKMKINAISRFSSTEKNEIIELAQTYNKEMSQLISKEESIEKAKKIEYNSKNPDWNKLKNFENEEEKIKKQIELKEDEHESILKNKYELDDDYSDEHKHK